MADIDKNTISALADVVASLGGTPRQGQIELTADVEDAMNTGGHLAAVAPTGTGKSLGYLVPAIRRAVLKGERTLISTESLALQNQIEDEDAQSVIDVVAADVENKPRVSTLKGFSNYVCQASLGTLTEKLFTRYAPRIKRVKGEGFARFGISVVGTSSDADTVEFLTETLEDEKVLGRIFGHDSTICEPSDIISAIIDLLSAIKDVAPAEDISQLFTEHTQDASPLGVACDILTWAWSNAGKSPRLLDINTYPEHMDAGVRQEITISTDQCAGTECPLFNYCAPRGSRRLAGQSDIVIANHSLIGVQAAKAVPAVLGSKSVGNFHHIVIDEAHALPKSVRSQGAHAVNRFSVHRIQRTLSDARSELMSLDPGMVPIVNATRATAEAINELALSFLDDREKKRPGDYEIDADSDYDEDIHNAVIQYLSNAESTIKEAMKGLDKRSAKDDVRRGNSLLGHIADVKETLKEAVGDTPGIARWIEIKPSKSGGFIASINVSPVDVSSMLGYNVYRQKVADTRTFDAKTAPGEVIRGEQRGIPEYAANDAEAQCPVDDDGYEVYFDSSVVCLSATLPKNFWLEAGMDTRGENYYESPFAEAYEDSAAFSPQPTDDDIEQLMSRNYGRYGFDAKLHPRWAIGIMGDLIEANGGRALVLSSTSAAEKQYTEWLTKRFAGTDITILSKHTSGKSKDALIEAFRADEKSVLVGSRGYMTGVNVKGEALSLVIVDRIPRSAGNLIDNARAESLADSLNLTEWEGRERVYSSDAALLLEQAFGRLIRQISDSGMVALLDPRIAKRTDLSLKGGSRTTYARLLREFGYTYSDPDKAVEWLEARRRRKDGQ